MSSESLDKTTAIIFHRHSNTTPRHGRKKYIIKQKINLSSEYKQTENKTRSLSTSSLQIHSEEHRSLIDDNDDQALSRYIIKYDQSNKYKKYAFRPNLNSYDR